MRGAIPAACNLTRVRGRGGDALLVVVVALLARVAVVLWARDRFPAAEDGVYYDVLARRIAEGDGYTWLWPDGAVTYVAHYPVGYPALLAGAYALFGVSVRVAMAVNAVFGAATACAAHRLVDGEGVARWRPLAAGLSLALHPALLFYTPAVMTEGLTASLLVVAAAMVGRARGRGDPRRWIASAGIVLGAATLVRPQCIVLAPVFGALAMRPGASARRRLAGAVVASAVALACVVPWTARNCERMHRCALVSVNGGWNLLIGATTETGAWQPIAVPPACATVWDEAGKDACFERAAWRAIGRAPAAWAARVPAKLAATFDYFGAAPWYLHASNGLAFDARAKVRLAEVETIACSLSVARGARGVRLDGGRARRRAKGGRAARRGRGGGDAARLDRVPGDPGDRPPRGLARGREGAGAGAGRRGRHRDDGVPARRLLRRGALRPRRGAVRGDDGVRPGIGVIARWRACAGCGPCLAPLAAGARLTSCGRGARGAD